MDDLKQEISNYEERESQLLDQRSQFQPGTLSYNEAANELDKVQTKLGQLREDQERVQKQTEDLDGIQLPLDYNLIFDDPRANEEITNLIRQVKAQVYADHNAYLQSVFEEHQQIVAGLNTTISMKQSVIDVGKPENERLTQLCGEKDLRIHTLETDLKDALSKRDIAVADKEEAETQGRRSAVEIQRLKDLNKELNGMLDVYRKPGGSAGLLQLTSTLRAETAEEKAQRIEKARVEQINKNLTKYNINPLPTKDALAAKEEPVTADQLDKSFREVAEGEAVVSSDAGGDRVQETTEDLQPAANGASAPTVEQLSADVAKLQEQIRTVFEHLELSLELN